MIITCLRDDLSNALQTVQRAISPKSIMPILTGVLMEAGEDKLALHATDLEIYMRNVFSAKVETPGRVVVNGRLVSDIVKNIDNELVKLEAKENQLFIEGGKSRFSLRTLPVEDFPVMPEEKQSILEEMNLKMLHGAIGQVVKAASRDDKRPVLQGIFVEFKDDFVHMVSTDSYRLAVTEVGGIEQMAEGKEMIIPVKAMQEIHRWGNKEDKVSIFSSEGQIRFDLGDTVMLVREIEGKFPNWKQLLPSEHKISVRVNRDSLMSAIKRVSLIGSTITMDVKPGEINLNAESREVGSAEERLEAAVEGGEIRIAVNAEFFADGISALAQEEALILLNEAEKPGLIKGDDDSYKYLIMPIKI
jgi:DNA polymerase III subunit beta